MTCAKRTVTCVIKTMDGRHFVGDNGCFNTQEVCPREDGEGYDKCWDICQQKAHAEQNAIWNMPPFTDTYGATAYVIGHVHVCPDCKKALNDAGITDIRVME